MATYNVGFRPNGEFSVRVTIPDDEIPEDQTDILDRVIDEARNAIPNDVCAQCSGWGQVWSLDFGDPEVTYVEDSDSVVLLDGLW
jgi:hypothetical protein